LDLPELEMWNDTQRNLSAAIHDEFGVVEPPGNHREALSLADQPDHHSNFIRSRLDTRIELLVTAKLPGEQNLLIHGSDQGAESSAMISVYPYHV